MFETVYLGLGSNVGDRNTHIHQAITLLGDHPHIEVIRSSTLIETKAISAIPQPDFLNGVLSIKTLLTPVELHTVTLSVEKQLGRQSKGTYDPRTIDLDILFYGPQIVCQEELMIPHPMAHERDFVLIPLHEIAPHFIHPVLQESIETLYNRVVWGVY